jgi:hypothetical protein
MMYLSPLTEDLGQGFDNLLPVRNMFTNNIVVKDLKKQGYFTRSVATGFLLTDHMNTDSISRRPLETNAFQNQLISATPLPQIFNSLHLGNQFDAHRLRILFALDHIANRPPVQQPVFTFVHILAPHPPFVLDQYGEPLHNDGIFIIKDGNQFIGSKDEYYDGYTGQLTYISKRILDVIQEILANPTRPVIIVLQGDHGPGLNLVRDSWEKTNLQERMTILNAYYFPDQNYRALYPGISPVNTFRVIMNQFLGAQYMLLEDRSYFVSFSNPYNFHDVSDLVR